MYKATKAFLASAIVFFRFWSAWSGWYPLRAAISPHKFRARRVIRNDYEMFKLVSAPARELYMVSSR